MRFPVFKIALIVLWACSWGRAATTPEDPTYQTKTSLRLPVEGEWTVLAGGRTFAENPHRLSRDQQYAYDLIIVREGRSHSGDGSANEQFYAFGQNILAPGAGVVVEAVDGVEDNIPRKQNLGAPLGNHVILDHGNGEFSFLAHLKKGSVRVKNQERVEAGALLGLCGNSGSSGQPHLHFHLQTTALFLHGEGLPAQFNGYSADGTRVDRGEPRKGQVIRPL